MNRGASASSPSALRISRIVDLEDRVADENAGPDRVEQFLLRDQLAADFRQVSQQRKCLRRQRDRRRRHGRAGR